MNEIYPRSAWLTFVRVMMFLSIFTAGSFNQAGASTPSQNPTNAEQQSPSLPGFEHGFAEVNGIKIHYVAGGKGSPLILLPGWPQTWWEFHKIMPALAKHYRVIAVDLRGMGDSDKPESGFDKKNMAKDIHELIRKLGYQKVFIAGHDIGAMVAFSFAANYPEDTLKLALMDVPHPDKFFASIPMLPKLGQFADFIDDEHPGYPWWFALNQVRGLPEKLLEGRFHILQDWMFDYLLKDSSSIGSADRAIYKAAYKSPESIRAGNGWYQTFPQDIADSEKYRKVDLPILALGATGYSWLADALDRQATHVKLVKIENSGHFITEEQPDTVIRLMIDFFN